MPSRSRARTLTLAGEPRERVAPAVERSVRLEFRLRGGPRAAADAREQLAAWVGPLSGSSEAAAALLLTELVTNAVRHGRVGYGEEVRVTVDRSGDRLRVAVTDPGPGFGLPPSAANQSGEGGYGLVLVDRLTPRWGFERGPKSTTVWFELPD